MPFFAPNIYEVKDDKQIYSNKPDMARAMEVSEDRANQVFRKQKQWIEVFPEKKQEPVVQQEKKKPGRPRKE